MRDGEAVRLVPVHARDLDGHVAGAAHRHAVAPRREQQELLLQLLAVRLQNLEGYFISEPFSSAILLGRLHPYLPEVLHGDVVLLVAVVVGHLLQLRQVERLGAANHLKEDNSL